ncbi:site-specific DNA-methyltransferase [Campylobacter upsaliensis]|uniref:site-specific DNA-methyltransferase n=1 Tax=Campylobacter upsaliensis TaxID=28080 RepID=UPI0022EBA20E|nr:site-specific DNA-methyltransferase [Campylobacter upsaliensis]
MPTKKTQDEKIILTKDHIKKANIIDTTKEHNPLLDYLAKHHPETLSEERLNLKALEQSLGFSPSSMQGYELSFIGKPLANSLYSTPTTKELKELDPKHSQNIIIKGDNLHALKLLKSAYDNKIKMIYIDPPYNTKSEKFIYDDNFIKEYQKLLIELDLLKLDSNAKVLEKSEVLHFLTNPSGDKSHSGWLSFMYPRLKLARDLLKDDGVIFISIDDNEQANLKILCDEIFGEENFVANLVWHKKDNASFLGKDIVDLIEYILVYKKSNKFNGTRDNQINPEGHRELIIKSSNIGERILNKNYCLIENGNFSGLLEKGKYGSEQFGIEILENVEIYNGIPKNNIKIKGKFCWSQAKIDEEILMGGRIEIKAIKGMKPIFYKNFGENIPYRPMRNLLSKKIEKDDVFTNNDAAEEIKKMFNGIPVFDYSKPSKLIKKFIRNVTNTGGGGGEDIVLDFFAGSGTTAQAVMELNKEDGGDRRFILVQLDEAIDEAKSKVAYDFCKNELKSQNPVISDITIERVKRAAAKIAKQDLLNTKELDLNFRLFTMEQKPELVSEDKDTLRLIIHAHLSPQDKALNLALQSGKMLHKKLESIIKDKLYQCENSLYIVQMDKEVLDYIKNKTHDEIVYLNAFDDIDLQEYLNLESHLKTRLYVVFQ